MLLTLPSLSDVTAIALYCMCIMSATAVTSGWMANVMDLAPQLSGVVLTVSQTLGIWTFFFVPIFVSYVTANVSARESVDSAPRTVCLILDSAPRTVCLIVDSAPRTVCLIVDSAPRTVYLIMDSGPRTAYLIMDSAPR